MSGEDNTPPSNSGDDAGRGGQRQPQGGQPQGGQPQGGQPQGGQPQGGQPQGGQAPPQGGQAPPQGGQYGGQPQGYSGPSTMDKITGALGSSTGKGYIVVTALLALVASVSAGIVLSLTSVANGSSVSGPILAGGFGPVGTGGFGTALAFGGVVVLMIAATGLGVLLSQTLDEGAAGTAATAGVTAFLGALILSLLVSVALVLNLPDSVSGAGAPDIADALVGAIIVGVGALIAAASGAFVADRFDPHDHSQPASGYQGAPGGQPPQGGQGPR